MLFFKEFSRIRKKMYDVTIFQTPEFRQKKGYRQVYRTEIEGANHSECLENVFRKFNIADCIPEDYKGRFISTGDIVFIDEGRGGQYYYQLKPGGWKNINRIHIRWAFLGMRDDEKGDGKSCRLMKTKRMKEWQEGSSFSYGKLFVIGSFFFFSRKTLFRGRFAQPSRLPAGCGCFSSADSLDFDFFPHFNSPCQKAIFWRSTKQAMACMLCSSSGTAFSAACFLLFSCSSFLSLSRTFFRESHIMLWFYWE